MAKLRVGVLVVSLVACMLTACSPRDLLSVFDPVETRINSAFPLADPVRTNKAWMTEFSSGAQLKDFESQLDFRLKLRALNCAKGYLPSRFASNDEIRSKLSAGPCFAEADAELARWIGLRRAGVVLAQPPLKATPKSPPAFISADGFITSASFASNAPFALLEIKPGPSIQVVDMETSKPVFREVAASSAGQLSPNGRLFTMGEEGRTRIRDTETGAVIVELPSVRAYDFNWLDSRTAMFKKSGNGPESMFLIDFVSGKEIPLVQVVAGSNVAAAAPGKENEFVIFSHRSASRISVDRSGREPEVALVAEKVFSGGSWASNTSGVTADNGHFFGMSQGMKVFNMNTLVVEDISLDPFQSQLSWPTPDPDKFIFSGFIQPYGGEPTRIYLYSISKREVAQVDTSKLSSSRFVYLKPYGRQGVINDRKIEVLTALPLLDAMPLAKFSADISDIANQRKLAAFERQQGLALRDFPQRSQDAPSQFQTSATSPLAQAARDATVEAVGVYQGSRTMADAGGGRKFGAVEVRVRRSSNPMVLVLSSYEPVRWTLIPEPGAQLAAVLVSGYYPSEVVGAGAARVVRSGSNYAYKEGSGEFNALNREVLRATGKTISLFQGSYEGSRFSVGGAFSSKEGMTLKTRKPLRYSE